MRPLLFLLAPACALGLAACGTQMPDGNGSADQNLANASDTLTPEPIPVRVGELGPSFQACSADGTTHHLEAGESLPVRSAPFDNAPQTGAVPTDARFFVCNRSLDEKWFGIVYDKSGTLAPACGVSEPADTHHDYAGPCQSGWVESAYVKLIAGGDQKPPVANQTAPASGG
jgi:hypothetical protein